MEKRAILVKQVDALSNNQLLIQMFTIGDGLLKVPSRRDQDLVIKNDVLQAAEIVLFFAVCCLSAAVGRNQKGVAPDTAGFNL
ncbi:MAG TPA: hypothetical protein PK201_14745, partial [Accumulibacter sp.]|nr:hypothetical protein [Accumulibacter sp.]